MDLCLQTGWTLPFIATMKERELALWHRYACQKGFPLRRIEYGLARVCQLIAQTMGGANNLSLSDFLFDPPPEPAEITDEEVAALRRELGFPPDK